MLTLQYIPYAEIEKLDSSARIKKLLKPVKEEKIVLLEGKLKKTEEAELIQKTMEQINRSFKGIEIATIEPEENTPIFKKLFFNLLLGNRSGITIIGPATIVKDIKKDPGKIQLFMKEGRKRRKKR